MNTMIQDILDAQQGDQGATEKLFSSPVVQSTMRSMSSYMKTRLSPEVFKSYQEELAGLAYIALKETLATFVIEKANTLRPLVRFSQMFHQDLVTGVKKWVRDRRRRGITGKVYAAGSEPEFEKLPQLEYQDKDASTILDAWSSFIEDPSLDVAPEPTLREVLKYIISRDQPLADSNALGVSHVTLRARAKNVKTILQKHGLTFEDITYLIHTFSKEKVLETL